MNKLGVVIPYRDRKKHLEYLIPELKLCLYEINHEIIVVEQNNEKLFNVGMLRNIGAEFLKDCNYYCFHDVDMIPDLICNDYTFENGATHLATMCSQFKYKMPYKNYIGGVLLFEKNDFKKVNGYSNNYWGWGSEDDDLYNRIKINKIIVNKRKCIFQCFDHKRDTSNLKNNIELRKLNMKNEDSFKNDGLTTLNFKIEEIENKKDFILIKTII